MGDYQVRFCERLRGETPLCLLGAFSVFLFAIFLRDQQQTARDERKRACEQLNRSKTAIEFRRLTKER